MTNKERREWYLSHGICPHCGRNDLQKGYKLCLECRMKDNERHKSKTISDETRKKQKAAQKALADKRKAEGICVRCGKRKTHGKHTNCTVCRAAKAAKQREYNRKQGMMPIELRGEGYCTRCYKPIESGKLCAECYEYLVQQAAEAWNRRAGEPCDLCRHAPPSSGDGKPCTMCPAVGRIEEDGDK